MTLYASIPPEPNLPLGIKLADADFEHNWTQELLRTQKPM